METTPLRDADIIPNDHPTKLSDRELDQRWRLLSTRLVEGHLPAKRRHGEAAGGVRMVILSSIAGIVTLIFAGCGIWAKVKGDNTVATSFLLCTPVLAFGTLLFGAIACYCFHSQGRANRERKIQDILNDFRPVYTLDPDPTLCGVDI